MGIVDKATRWVQDARTKRELGQRASKIKAARTLFEPEDPARCRIPIVYGDNHTFLTDTGAYTLHRLAMQPWGFLSNKQKEGYYYQADAFFSQHYPSHQDASGHLIVTNRTYTADEWHANLRAATEADGGLTLPVFDRYVEKTKEQLNATSFYERDVYVCTRLGARKEKSNALNTLSTMVDDFLLGAAKDTEAPTPLEIARWHEAAEATSTTLATTWLQGQPTNRSTLEWLIRHKASPGLPTPTLWGHTDEAVWGLGRWRTLLASETEVVDLGKDENKQRLAAVKYDGPTGISYACYLPLTYSPSDILHDQNWMHRASGLDFPVDIDLRFQIIDPERASKELQKYADKAESQQIEDAEAGHKPDAAAIEQQAELEQAKQQTRKTKKPLAYWQAIFSVHATDPNELKKRVGTLIAHYKTIDFKLECPTMDQRELAYQCLPGSEILVKDWEQRTDTNYLAAAAPWLSSTIGDGKGLYQGFTLIQEGNTVQPGSPFFYDLQLVADDDGKAPTEAVAGFPGSGKRLSVDELVPLADGGYKRMGDLVAGDRILDERGVPCTVTVAHPIVEDTDSYRVVFDDGTVVLADAEHLWYTQTDAEQNSARAAAKPRQRKTRGKPGFAAAMRHLAATAPEDATTGPRRMRQEWAGKGGPNRDIWERVAKALEPVGWYSPGTMRNGGTGRKYPLYSVRAYAAAMALWADTPLNDQRHKAVGTGSVKTTADIAATLHRADGATNHSIPLAAPVQYPTADLPLDPYVMGAWLGDGRSEGSNVRVGFTGIDPEIWQHIELAGYEVRHHPTEAKEHYVYGLRAALEAAGVHGDKHIPDAYMYADHEQRLALLQGLMDTDGTVAKDGRGVVFNQSDERIATQVRSLVASLGMKATIRSHPSGYYDAAGVWVECKRHYSVAFRPNDKVFRLTRKASRLNLAGDARSTTQRRYIVACEPVDPVPMRCITVDSPSHLYLCTDQFVPTHNTVSRGLKCVYEDAMRGVTQFVWDPKGDFLPLHEFARAFGLDPALVHLIDINNPRTSITLDPFMVAEVNYDDPEEPVDERPALARTVLNRLLYKQVKDPNDGTVASSIITSVVKHVHEHTANPSMRGVMRVLEAVKNSDQAIFQDLEVPERNANRWADVARNVWSELDAVQASKLGKLLFKDSEGTSALKAKPGSLTIFVAMGLNIADQEELKGRDPDPDELLSDVIASMMVNHIRNLLAVEEIRLDPKAAVFDEWHAIRRAGGAETLYAWLKRMGRSRRTSVRQLSQSALDFDSGSLSTVWCGYADSEEEAEASCRLLGIEENAQNVNRIMNMQPGQFLFRDSKKRVAWVQVDIWDKFLMDKWNTQAAAKKQMAKAEAEAGRGQVPEPV